ncbi:hypothetical protein SANTM175S_05215 [Streptomyces antimycoticus]
MGRRLVQVKGPGQHLVPHRQHHLDHTGHPRGRLGVPDVRLDRAQQQRAFALLPVGGQQRLCLDRVAQAGAGAVCLHRVHVRGGQPGTGQRGPDHSLLRGSVRRGQAVRGAVLVDGGAPYDRQDPMAVAAGVGQPFQQQQAHTFAPAGAVRRVGERLAASVGGQSALPGELHEDARVRHQRHPAGEGEGAFAGPQRLRRQVQRDQRRRAGGVHGDRRPFQTEGVREPAGDHAAGATGQEIALGPLGRLACSRSVALRCGADEHPGLASLQRRRRDTRPLHRLPGHFQQQPLLGVHRERLTRRDPEEPGVELPRIVDKATGAHVRSARAVRIGAVQAVQVPAPVVGQIRDRVTPGVEQLPQLLGRGHPARIAAGHADDHDRIVAGVSRGGGRRHGLVDGAAVQFPEELTGQDRWCRVVEDRGGRQPDPGGGTQPVAQLDGRERVESGLREGTRRVDIGGGAMPQHGRHMCTDQVEHMLFALGDRHPGHPVAQ